MQRIIEVLTQHFWLGNYIRRGWSKKDYKITMRPLNVTSCANVADKIDSLASCNDADLLDEENYPETIFFLHKDGTEVAYYDGASNSFWDSKDPAEPQITLNDIWGTAVHWIVCEIVESAERAFSRYLLVYEIVCPADP